jgi:putative heme-binding domain-containing protein
VLARHPDWLATPGPAAKLLTDVAALIGGGRDEGAIRQLLETIVAAPENPATWGRLVLLAGLAEGMERSGRSVQSVLDLPPASGRETVERLRQVLRAASELTLAERAPIEQRVLALELLARAQPSAVARHLLNLLSAAQPQPMQSAAARALAKVADPQLARQALARWATYSTGGRRDLLAALLRSPGLTTVLLDALEQETLDVRELDPVTRQALQRLPNAGSRGRAQALLKKHQPADRQEVLQRYRAALTLAGEPSRGAVIFVKHCAGCHQLHGQGHRVGADLSGIAGRPRETLLTDILDPSSEVAPDYLNYTLATKNGRVLTGLVAAESGTSVKLRRAEGVEETVLRREIQELRSTGRSLMPEGLEQVLGVQDVADLLEFLHRQKPPKRPPGH